MPKIPKPFKRPSINLDGDVKKEWREEYVDTLAVGDMVQDKGRIVEIYDGVEHGLKFLSGEKVFYPIGSKVMAFTAIIE